MRKIIKVQTKVGHMIKPAICLVQGQELPNVTVVFAKLLLNPYYGGVDKAIHVFK